MSKRKRNNNTQSRLQSNEDALKEAARAAERIVLAANGDVGLDDTEESDKQRREREREALKKAKLEDARDLCSLFGVPYFDFMTFLGSYPDALLSDEAFFHGAFEAFYSDRVLKDYARIRVSANTDGETLINNVPLASYEGDDQKIDFAIPLLQPGLTVVFASSNSGKSTFVNAVAAACLRDGINFRRFSFQEPESSTNASRLGFMSPGWRAAVSDPSNRLIIADSIKQTMRLSEPGFPTLSGGIESYFLATLSNLSAAFREAGRSMIVTVNPLFLSDETVKVLEKDLIGSTTGVVVLDGAAYQKATRTVVVSGRYNYREGDRAWHSVVVHARVGNESESVTTASTAPIAESTVAGAYVDTYSTQPINS